VAHDEAAGLIAGAAALSGRRLRAKSTYRAHASRAGKRGGSGKSQKNQYEFFHFKTSFSEAGYSGIVYQIQTILLSKG
jgi:hypothetical protein